MRMNHDTHIDTEIDEALTRAGITADNIPGTREAAREFARLVTTRTNHTPQDALRIAAEAIARTLRLAATAPARGGTIPQVTFLPPATADAQADLDAIAETIARAAAVTAVPAQIVTLPFGGSLAVGKAVRR